MPGGGPAGAEVGFIERGVGAVGPGEEQIGFAFAVLLGWRAIRQEPGGARGMPSEVEQAVKEGISALPRTHHDGPGDEKARQRERGLVGPGADALPEVERPVVSRGQPEDRAIRRVGRFGEDIGMQGQHASVDVARVLVVALAGAGMVTLGLVMSAAEDGRGVWKVFAGSYVGFGGGTGVYVYLVSGPCVVRSTRYHCSGPWRPASRCATKRPSAS